MKIETVGQQVVVNDEALEPIEALRYAKHLEEAARDAITTHLEDCEVGTCSTCATAKAFGLRAPLRSI